MKNRLRDIGTDELGPQRKGTKKLTQAIASTMHIASQKGSKDPFNTMADIIASEIESCCMSQKDSKETFEHIVPFIESFGVQLTSEIEQKIYVLIDEHMNDSQMHSYSSRSSQIQHEQLVNIWPTYPNGLIECYCKNFNVSPETCYRCNRQFHAECFWPKDKDQVSECPWCFLQHCRPEKPVQRVLFACYLRKSRKSKIEYRGKFHIPLNPPKSKKTMFEIRCVRLSEERRFELSWPEACSIHINKSKVSSYTPLDPLSNLKRRNDRELDLQRWQLHPLNDIFIEATKGQNHDHEDHLLMLLEVGKASHQDIKDYFSSQQLTIRQSKLFLQKTISSSSDQVAIEKVGVTLNCPYFNTKIQIPARSLHCLSHFQPFDLSNFIIASICSKNSAKSWKCPLCGKRAYDLLVDQYLLSLISDAKTNSREIQEIVFKADAEPEYILGPEDVTSSLSEQSPVHLDGASFAESDQNGTIEISDDESGHKDQVKSICEERETSTPSQDSQTTVNHKAALVIDLDDSEEEVIPPKRRFKAPELENEEMPFILKPKKRPNGMLMNRTPIDSIIVRTRFGLETDTFKPSIIQSHKQTSKEIRDPLKDLSKVSVQKPIEIDLQDNPSEAEGQNDRITNEICVLGEMSKTFNRLSLRNCPINLSDRLQFEAVCGNMGLTSKEPSTKEQTKSVVFTSAFA